MKLWDKIDSKISRVETVLVTILLTAMIGVLITFTQVFIDPERVPRR